MLNNDNMMTPVSNESVVQQVINKITDAIMAGEFKPGDKLPTEMEMISLFKVSRNSCVRRYRPCALTAWSRCAARRAPLYAVISPRRY